MKLIIEKHPVNLEKLASDLRALSPNVGAVSVARGHVVVQVREGVTQAVLQSLRDTILSHNADDLTPEQQAALDAEGHRAEVRARFATSVLKDKDPAAIYTALDNQIESWSTLADAKADLKSWLPLLAAAVAWLVVEG